MDLSAQVSGPVVTTPQKPGRNLAEGPSYPADPVVTAASEGLKGVEGSVICAEGLVSAKEMAFSSGRADSCTGEGLFQFKSVQSALTAVERGCQLHHT